MLLAILRCPGTAQVARKRIGGRIAAADAAQSVSPSVRLRLRWGQGGVSWLLNWAALGMGIRLIVREWHRFESKGTPKGFPLDISWSPQKGSSRHVPATGHAQ